MKKCKDVNFKNPMVKWWVNVIVTFFLIVCATIYSFLIQASRSGSVIEGMTWAIWTFDFFICCWCLLLAISLTANRLTEKLKSEIKQ